MKRHIALVVSLMLWLISPCATAVGISGSVTNNKGDQICGLVLANGQFVFSCSPNGAYALDVPLDGAGQITIFAFADGHFPYKKIVTTAGRYDLQMTVASSQPSPSTGFDKTAQLVGGTWTYTYTIISTFSDSYTFTSVNSTPDSHGDYFASGTSAFGRLVVGGYVSSTGQWAVLTQGTIIDQFYTFTFSGNNLVSGCYFQISPPGSTNLSRCYSMTGLRSPPKSMALLESNPEQLLREVAMEGTPVQMDPTTLETYMRLKSKLAE